MKPIEELTFTDDFMFGHVMQNKEICTGLLERLLNIKIKKLVYPKLQKHIAPYYKSKGVRLDVYVEDSDRVFDIEIQNFLDDELPKRTRFYQSIMDIDLLLKGKKYSELKESFIIFVSKNDFFKVGLPCYTFSNQCHEKQDLELNDKTKKIFFNASAFLKEKDLEKKAILQYIMEKDSTSDFTTQIDEIIEQAKHNEIFRGDYMIWGLAEQDAEKRGFNVGVEQGIAQGLAQGLTQGAERKAIETARNMLLNNIDINIIANCTGLQLDVVEQLATETQRG